MKMLRYSSLIIAMLMWATTSMQAQDLLARQAPIDRKLKAVDSLRLLHQKITFEATEDDEEMSDLYADWENNQIGKVNVNEIPDSFNIKLTGFCMPTTNTRITSNFGMRRRRMHNGVDVKVYVGDTIRAAFDGRVRIVKYERRGYGKYVVIRHNNGLETVYGHLSKQLVLENQPVKAGDVIGMGGNTGRSTGSHLHFETRFLGQAINPVLMFDFEKQDITTEQYTFYKSKIRQKGRAGRKNGQMAVAGDGEARYHKVRQGDTLARIAKNNGTTIENLCRLNNIKRTTILSLGRVLRVS